MVTLAMSTQFRSDPPLPAIKGAEPEMMLLAQNRKKATDLQIATHTRQQRLANGGREVPGMSLTF